MANPSNIPKVGRDGTVKFYDNSGVGGANVFTASYVRGDVSVNAGAKPEFIDVFVRGKWKATRKGNDPIYEGSFSMPLVQFTNGTNEVIVDVLDNTGAVNGVWTKHTATVEHWNVGLRFEIEGTDNGDSADHYIDFAGCVLTWELSESPNGETSINVTFRSPDFDNYSKSGPS